jgi:chloramphenicol-sensitive protein RarD
MAMSQTRSGALFALTAYLIWGLAPVYFKYIDHVPADEIVTHRVIWSFFFMIILLSISRKWYLVKHALQYPLKVCLLAVSAVLIGCNWLLFIWAVNNNHMLDTSLGYFITPLMNMLLGLLFLGERFRPRQWLSLALAVCAVLVQLWQFGSLPYIGLGLAFTFSIYGLIRKKIGVDAQSGMLIETTWLLPVAIIYLLFFAHSATSNLSENTLTLNILLAAAGVITTVPLLCFTAAATRLALSTLGFFQYIGPTLTFILAITLYGEQATAGTLVTFGFIWSGLAIFIWDALSYQKKKSAVL